MLKWKAYNNGNYEIKRQGERYIIMVIMKLNVKVKGI